MPALCRVFLGVGYVHGGKVSQRMMLAGGTAVLNVQAAMIQSARISLLGL
jgi:hypothetical protein